MKLKSVFEEWPELWPKERLKQLKPILEGVAVAKIPRDLDQLFATDFRPEKTVVVSDDAALGELMPLLDRGFRHFVQQNREDFAQELLAACLMISRPKAFVQNPITFFFNGFESMENLASRGRQLLLKFKSNVQKDGLLEKLEVFLSSSAKLSAIKEICLQAADEMISNAVFAAPVDSAGQRINKGADRNSTVWLPNRSASLFSCFSDARVVIGCEDPYGSLNEFEFSRNVREQFREPSATVRSSGPGGGVGFKYLIENSANFYLLSSTGSRTLVASGFLLGGWKANLSAKKHLHFSFGR